MAGSFTFDGKDVPIEDGDTVGSALHRAGVRAIARSLRYHRPRGLRCCTGSCASCLVDVDGVPNVPACMAPAVAGSEVTSQNTLGSAKRDLFAVVDKVYRKGFDPHGMMTRPALLNKAFLEAVRFMSGVGRVPDADASSPSPPAQRHTLHVDELIVGGGLHGLRRAHAAQGVVLLVEELPTLGGSALFDPTEREALKLADSVPPRVQVWTSAVAFGLYDGVAGVLRGNDLWEVTADRVTVAPGRHDGFPLFANNDLPGVLSLRGARRLLHQHKVLPGQRIVAHSESKLPQAFVDAVRAAGGAVVAHGKVDEVRGATCVEAAHVGGSWVPCDAVVYDVPGTPRVELLQQAGCELGFRGGVLTTEKAEPEGVTSVPKVHALFTEAIEG